MNGGAGTLISGLVWLVAARAQAREDVGTGFAVLGAHYFTFRTAYGLSVFWGLGAVIVAMSVGAVYGIPPLAGSLVVAVGLVEVVVGLVLTVGAMRG